MNRIHDSDRIDWRRYFGELSYKQALKSYPCLEEDKARLDQFWARREDTLSGRAQWREALAGLVCGVTTPVLRHILGPREEMIERLRFADHQSAHPLPDEVPETFDIYRGFNFSRKRQQCGLYWATDPRLAWEAIGWKGCVEEFPEWCRSGARSGLPQQGIVHTRVHRDDVLWWVPAGTFTGIPENAAAACSNARF